MPNVIDDQQRFREIQTSIFSQFDRDLLGNTLPPDDETIVHNCLDYILEQIKRDVSTRLMKIETLCRFYILQQKSDYAVLALQVFYDLFFGIDNDFQNNILSAFKNYNDEKKKKNPADTVPPEIQD